jgi:hypothetical protein
MKKMRFLCVAPKDIVTTREPSYSDADVDTRAHLEGDKCRPVSCASSHHSRVAQQTGNAATLERLHSQRVLSVFSSHDHERRSHFYLE